MNLIRYEFALAGVLALIGMTEQLKAQPSHSTALLGVTVIDGTGAPALPDAVILIESGRILQVGPRSKVAIPTGAERKDLTGLQCCSVLSTAMFGSRLPCEASTTRQPMPSSTEHFRSSCVTASPAFATLGTPTHGS